MARTLLQLHTCSACWARRSLSASCRASTQAASHRSWSMTCTSRACTPCTPSFSPVRAAPLLHGGQRRQPCALVSTPSYADDMHLAVHTHIRLHTKHIAWQGALIKRLRHDPPLGACRQGNLHPRRRRLSLGRALLRACDMHPHDERNTCLHMQDTGTRVRCRRGVWRGGVRTYVWRRHRRCRTQHADAPRESSRCRPQRLEKQQGPGCLACAPCFCAPLLTAACLRRRDR